MPAGTTPIFPTTPYAVNASLAAATACATRAPTATASLAAANILAFVPVSTNGLRIDLISVKACSSSITAPTAANIVGIWLWDGTTAWLFDEILVTVVTPSASATASFVSQKSYTNLVLPSTWAMYASVGVTTTASTTALSVQAFGGAY
jgi:hypothetical protein